MNSWGEFQLVSQRASIRLPWSPRGNFSTRCNDLREVLVKFGKILKSILWRLVTEEQISYQSIARDYSLDEQGIEDVRRFLIRNKALARDLDGRFLVWAPSADGARALSGEASLAPLDIPRAMPAEPGGSAGTGDAGGAQRRQLTVMFCDLVGSTDLASRL